MPAELNDSTGRYDADIEGHTFSFELWPASQALRALVDISAMLGMPLAALKASDTNSAAFSDIGKHLMLHGDQGIKLVKRLTSAEGGVMVSPSGTAADTPHGAAPPLVPIRFDDFYRGKLGLMFHVAQCSFNLQFGSLTEAVAKMGLSFPAPAAASGSLRATSAQSG